MDKRVAFTDEDDINLKIQLPWDVQQQIFVDFVFKEFLENFKEIF